MQTAPVRGLSLLPVRRGYSNTTSLSLAGAFTPSCVAMIQSSALRGEKRALVASQRRMIHSSERRTSTIADLPSAGIIPPSSEPRNAPLSVLPLSMIIRSLGTTMISSSTLLLGPSLKIMGMLAHSSNPILNPDSNPLLRFFLKKTFYAQFCAGENAAEVRSTIAGLKGIGFNGVILGYAKEVVLPENVAQSLVADADSGKETPAIIENEISPWAHGTLETVGLAEPGDFVALKFTGAGRLALEQLANNEAPGPYLTECIDAICKLASDRGVRLLFDAEQDALQDGIDSWTIQFARKYNKSAESATVHGTYQAYKKATPAVLSKHLAQAQADNFTLGVKLVRGAYINSDPRDRFYDTKEGTDECYNGVSAAILTRQWGPMIQGQGEFPNAHIVLATHNAESVRRARAICDTGAAKSDIACAQLQGMADEISCELVEASRAATNAPALPVYKYLVWGTVGECMKYLLRRAQENKDAVQRTKDGRDAMWAELVRRCKTAVGFA